MVDVIDHEQGMLDTMPYYWQTKPLVKGLIRYKGSRWQDLENTCHQYLNETDLYTAYGVYLDRLGLILGVERDGKTDEEYRTALLSKASVRGASGTTRDVKRVAKAVTEATECKVFTHFPLCTYIFVNSIVNKGEAESIQDAHMATVQSKVIWSIDENYVRTSPTSDPNLHTIITYLCCAGDDVMQAGEPDALAGEYSINPYPTYDTGMGFTSLVEDATSYEVIDDKGALCAVAADSSGVVNTGYIIDDAGNYIVFDNGDNMRYVD